MSTASSTVRDAHFVHGAFESKPEQLAFHFPERKMGVSFLRGGAMRYAARRGMQWSGKGLSEMQSDPHLGTRIGQAYEHAQHSVVPTHRVRRAYEAMKSETAEQYDYLTKPRHQGGLGVSVEMTDEEPYEHHHALQQDVLKNRRLKVLSSASTGGHPFFTDEENNKFRAVHDAFGHAAIGRSFSRHGEEAAYHSHAQMYSPVAREAMTAETRGQNNLMIYGKGTGFPEQKAVTLPSWAQRIRTPSTTGPQRSPRLPN
jgi:hypothetical protein